MVIRMMPVRYFAMLSFTIAFFVMLLTIFYDCESEDNEIKLVTYIASFVTTFLLFICVFFITYIIANGA